MTMMLMCCEMVIENEIQQGLGQKDIALTYAMTMHSEDNGRDADWKRINQAIIAKWGVRGLSRIKTLAHSLHERRNARAK